MVQSVLAICVCLKFELIIYTRVDSKILNFWNRSIANTAVHSACAACSHVSVIITAKQLNYSTGILLRKRGLTSCSNKEWLAAPWIFYGFLVQLWLLSASQVLNTDKNNGSIKTQALIDGSVCKGLEGATALGEGVIPNFGLPMWGQASCLLIYFYGNLCRIRKGGYLQCAEEGGERREENSAHRENRKPSPEDFF